LTYPTSGCIVPSKSFLQGKERNYKKQLPFTWIRGNLFKLGLDQILRRCVREEKVFDILLAYHDGPFLGLAGYYWPTLHQDERRYTSRCDQCQRMGKPTPKDEIPIKDLC